jgi:hypothetical protein
MISYLSNIRVMPAGHAPGTIRTQLLKYGGLVSNRPVKRLRILAEIEQPAMQDGELDKKGITGRAG